MKLHTRLKNMVRGGWFEYFYWIFMSVFVVVLVLGTSFYLYVSSILKNEAILQNNNTLNQLKNTQEAILAETDRTVSGVVLNSIIGNYMDYYRSNNTLIMMAAQKVLDNVENLYDSVESIYVWYVNDDLILSSDKGAVKFEQYKDATFLKNIRQFRTRQNYSRIKDDPNISVISFVNTIPIYVATGRPKAIVVFNLKSEALQNTVGSISLNNKSSLVITDSEGNIISRKTGDSDSGYDLAFKEIKKRGDQESGYFVMDLKGNNVLVSFVNSDKYGWRYIYVTPMSAITEGIRFLRIIIILICGLMLALGLGGALLLSHKLYSPIKSALAKFTPDNTEELKKIKETELLQNRIDNILHKNKSLKELLTEYDILRRDNFLLELVEMTSESYDRVEERLKYYHIDLFTDGWFVTFIISVDNAAKLFGQYSEKQINMLFIYIRENISEIVFQDCKGFFTGRSEGDFYLVANFSAEFSQDQIKDISRRMVDLLQDFVRPLVKFTFTIGVSLPNHTIDKLHESYEQAQMAVNHRLVIGYNQIIYYEELTEESDFSAVYPFSIEKQILNGIKMGSRSELMKQLDSFTEHIAAMRKENIELVRYYYLQLLTASIKCFYDIDRNLGTKLMQKEYYTAILKEGTIHDMSELIKDLYTDFLNYMDVLREGRSIERNQSMIKDICSFIEDNLGKDLSLDLLANKFHLSPYQLRKLFRDEMNVAPKGYIDDVKMRKAIELLTNTTLKIGEVAERIGYFSIPSFIHTFKVVTGKTPGEYRNENTNNSQ